MFPIKIPGFPLKILGFSFEILGISKICENRIPYLHIETSLLVYNSKSIDIYLYDKIIELKWVNYIKKFQFTWPLC